MTQRYYGNTHIFTSRGGGEETINIVAGPNETLNISGASISGGELLTTKTSTALNQYSLGTKVDYTVPSSDQLNGASVKTSITSGGERRIAYTGRYTAIPPADKGMLVQILVDTGSGFSSEGIIDIANASTDAVVPSLGFDKTGGNHVSFTISTDGLSDDMKLYTRVGSTWSFKSQISEMFCAQIDAGYMITGGREGYISIWEYDAITGWSELNSMRATDPSLPRVQYQEIDISGTSACFVSSKKRGVEVWESAGLVWDYQYLLTRLTTDSDISCVGMINNILVFATPERVYIHERSDSSSPYILSLTLEETGILELTCTSNTRFYGRTSTGVKFFMKNFDWNMYRTETLSNLASIASFDSLNFVAGKPTDNVMELYALQNPEPIETVTTSDIDLTDEVTMDSIYPIQLQNDVVFGGDITVSGVISGNMKPILASLRGSGNQVIPTASETNLTTVYQNNTSVIHNYNLPIDFTNGTITVNQAGIYMLIAGGSYASDNAGIRTLSVYKNAGVIIFESKDAQQNTTTTFNIHQIIELDVDDVLKLTSTQTSAGNLTLNSAYLQLMKLGI